MKQIGKTVLLLGALGLEFSIQAVVPDTRYNTIVERNIFRLTSPPPVVVPPAPDPALDRSILLSGISNIDGRKKAWFVIQPKAGGKDLPLYVSLEENVRQDFLEVVSISEQEGEVKILNSGNPMTLSLKNNSPKAVAGAAPAAGAAPGAASFVPPPVIAGAPQTPTANSYANPSYTGRPVTVAGGTPSGAQGFGQPMESGLRNIPSRTVRLPSMGVNPQIAPPAEPPVDPVTQRFMMEAQQEHSRQTGTQLPPLPPLPNN